MITVNQSGETNFIFSIPIIRIAEDSKKIPLNLYTCMLSLSLSLSHVYIYMYRISHPEKKQILVERALFLYLVQKTCSIVRKKNCAVTGEW